MNLCILPTGQSPVRPNKFSHSLTLILTLICSQMLANTNHSRVQERKDWILIGSILADTDQPMIRRTTIISVHHCSIFILISGRQLVSVVTRLLPLVAAVTLYYSNTRAIQVNSKFLGNAQDE